jgi:hypothetical protein
MKIKAGDKVTFNWWNNWKDQAKGVAPNVATRTARVIDGKVYATVNGYSIEVGDVDDPEILNGAKAPPT